MTLNPKLNPFSILSLVFQQLLDYLALMKLNGSAVAEHLF